jgi:hypothetical protein
MALSLKGYRSHLKVRIVCMCAYAFLDSREDSEIFDIAQSCALGDTDMGPEARTCGTDYREAYWTF